MKSVTALLCPRSSISLVTPRLSRFFAGRYNSQSNFDDFKDDYSPRQSSGMEGSNSGEQGSFKYPPRPSVPFESDLFNKFATLQDRELSAHIGSLIGDSNSADALLSNYSDSLKNKDASVAWKELSSDDRKRFVSNIFFLLSESNRSRGRFPSYALMSFVLEQSMRAQDPEPIMTLLNTLQNSTLPQSFIRGTLNNVFTEFERRRLNYNMFKMREAFSTAEKMFHNAIQQSTPTFSNITSRRNFNAIANYLSCVASGQFPVNHSVFRDIRSHFLSEDLSNGTPSGGVLAYTAIAASYKHNSNITIVNDNVAESLNEYIRVLNEDKRKHREVESFDYNQDEGDEESAAKKADDKIPLIAHGERVKLSQLFGVAQSMLIAESEGLRFIRNILNHMIDNLPNHLVHFKFRRWLTQHIKSQDLSKTTIDILVLYARALSRFVSVRRFPQIHAAVYKALASKIDYIRNSGDKARLLMALGPLHRFATEAEAGADGAESEKSAYGRQDITPEEKQIVQDLNDHLLQNILNEESNFLFDDNLSLVIHFIRHQKKFTPEDFKKVHIHRKVWEQLDKKKNISAEAPKIFQALSAYNLLEDEEMQKILVGTLDKLEARIATGVENRAASGLPEKESFNKSYYPLEQIQLLFLEKEGELADHQKVVANRLKEYKDKEKERTPKST